jgi:hypothetical protein
VRALFAERQDGKLMRARLHAGAGDRVVVSRT